MGFEPTVPCGTHAFQAGALNHSATPPNKGGKDSRISIKSKLSVVIFRAFIPP